MDWTVSFDRNFQMPVGRGLDSYHVNKKHGGWTSCRARPFIGRLRKLFFFREGGDNFFFKLLQHPHFVWETSNQHPHFFPRCSSDGSSPESRIKQVKEKHKYRPQKVICFHLQGCCCVLKRPPTLPSSKDSHCNDKRFENLSPSFRSLAFFLGSITAKSVDKWYRNFREFR